jgi:hypothetical protein
MPMTFVSSEYNTVTGTSQEIALTMVSGNQYVLRSDVDLYFTIGVASSTTASAADNSHFLAAGMPAYVCKRGTAVRVAVIAKSATGVCTLSLVEAGSHP